MKREKGSDVLKCRMIGNYRLADTNTLDIPPVTWYRGRCGVCEIFGQEFRGMNCRNADCGRRICLRYQKDEKEYDGLSLKCCVHVAGPDNETVYLCRPCFEKFTP